ncbi:MAG: flavodoxin [Anaerolineaceae bacterium]|nr:flavodoxin [Anaerolineaceae bacterium]
MSKAVTRRQFLIYMAAGIGVTTLTCAGIGAIASRRPIDIQFRKMAINRNPIKPLVLVTYASRAGSTMEIARTIAQELEKRHFIVDICPIKQIDSLEDYSHIIMGSAIRMGSPLPEIIQFINEHQSECSRIPLACFAVHLQHDGENEASRKARLACLDPIRKLLPLQHEVFFTGVYDPDKVSYIERLMGKTMHTPVGDFRNWTAIKDWSQSIF